MGHIFVIIGKSATGKDTLYAKIMKEPGLGLKTLVSYTTRPMREGEQDGREYFFKTVEEFRELSEAGKIIEHRVYHTVYGDWYYFTALDDQIDLCSADYLVIQTLEAYLGIKRFYEEKGMSDVVIPLYIEVTDRERIERALAREDSQPEPRIRELCRRFLADDADFSDENIEKAGINKRFSNMDSEKCCREIIEEIQSVRNKSR